jgi:plastocyanin
MGSISFSPSEITINHGDTVNWVWFGFHSTTSDTGIWDSGQHSPPHTFSLTFDTPGTFPYHCTVHGLSMAGTVIVN